MLRWVGLAVGVTFLGCSSSSSGSASCTSPAACGGSLVGTWTLVSACETAIAQSSNNSLCPNETVQVGAVDINGTVTFGADMTYSIALSQSVTETLNYPGSCLTVSGGITLTCDQIAQGLNTVTGAADAGLSPTTCATSSTGCTCTLSVPASNINESGTYATSGGTFTTAPSNGSGGGGGNYCVSGSTLHVVSSPTATDGGAAGPALAFVATKE
jgi:hypothetical protein